jgi:hypothetical protein
VQQFSSKQFGKQSWDKQDGQSEIVRAALCYAANGWPVVPLQRIDGQERSGDEFAYRRPRNQPNCLVTVHHAENIKEFWDAMPNSGLGIATGDESCIMAVHVYGDKGKRHVASLRLPPTWQAEAAGSIIYYFRQPNHLLMPEGFLPGASQALPGIDIAATRCFAVVPPTVYQSGEPYSWITPEGRHLADCPLSVIAVLEQKWRP